MLPGVYDLAQHLHLHEQLPAHLGGEASVPKAYSVFTESLLNVYQELIESLFKAYGMFSNMIVVALDLGGDGV